MIRNVSLEEISDGKLYTLNDMVKAGCGGCEGCSDCCRGMGESIVLDPLDFARMAEGLALTPQQLLGGYLELHVVDGIVLPNLKMVGESEQCLFLNKEGWCTVHSYRPGICRIFPLGRYYEEKDGKEEFYYFLQVHECSRPGRAKVKVRKWIDTPEADRYDRYILEWHHFLKEMQKQVAGADAQEAQAVSLYVLKTFYLQPYGGMESFYEEFYKRIGK